MSAQAIFLDIGGIILEINWRRTVEALGIFDRAKQDQIWSVLGSAKIHFELERGNATPDEFFSFVRSELRLSAETPLEFAWNKLILGTLPNVAAMLKIAGLGDDLKLNTRAVLELLGSAKAFDTLTRFKHCSQQEVTHG